VIFGGISGILLIGGAFLGTVVLAAPSLPRSKRDKRQASTHPRVAPGRMVRAGQIAPPPPKMPVERPHKVARQTTFDYSATADTADYAEPNLGFIEPAFDMPPHNVEAKRVEVVPYDHVEVPEGLDEFTGAIAAADSDEDEDDESPAQPFFSFSISNGTIDARLVAAGTLTWPSLTSMRGDHYNPDRRRIHIRRIVLVDSECEHALNLLLAYRQDEAIREVLLRSLSDFNYKSSSDILLAGLVDDRVFLRMLAARVAVDTWQTPAMERALAADRTDVVLAAVSRLVNVEALPEVDARVRSFVSEASKPEVLRKLSLLY